MAAIPVSMIPMNQVLLLRFITAAAGLEEGVVKLTDPFSCPGFRVVEDRRIRCHKAGGHGAETFLQGVMNSCNPVFIDVGQRLGSDNYYKYFVQFGLKQKTGIDLPGEAATIMHKKENIGPVELADYFLWTVFSDHPHPADHDSRLYRQWRKTDHASFRSGDSQS